MTKEKTPKSLTRKQLYNLVWKKPVMKIAKEYGLSDRGLGKLCERHGIPTPPRVYWAKKSSGQKVKKPPLLFSDKDGEGEKIIEQRVKTALNNIYRLKVQNSMESVQIGIHNHINRYKRDLTAEELEKIQVAENGHMLMKKQINL